LKLCPINLNWTGYKKKNKKKEDGVLLGMAALIFLVQIVFASAISEGDVCAGINDKLDRESNVFIYLL